MLEPYWFSNSTNVHNLLGLRIKGSIEYILINTVEENYLYAMYTRLLEPLII